LRLGSEIVASHGDERHCEPLHRGQKLHDFGGFAAGGKCEHNIAADHHSQVAVQGFGGMEKKSWVSGGRQRGGHFASDDSALAHSGDDDATGTVVEQLDGALEIARHRSGDTIGECAQCFGLGAHDSLANIFHDERDVRTPVPSRHCAAERGCSPRELKTRTCSSFSPPLRGTFLPLNETSTTPAFPVQNTIWLEARMVLTSEG